ncbi:MAG: tetraacyldisaccharide 4-kinase [Pedobacter sp.]|jgi:tetraacyldisaccharide 4'-kinase|nr:tetraacyldisaccharide 4-kinase [Pedobacter sp.]
MLRYLRLILFPFSFLYGLVVIIRNKCYDWGIFDSVQFDLPVICVGNLAVGGSGKTPVTEYLVKLLDGRRIAILSRGYGRKTKGFLLADANASASTIGDEPMQYYSKFSQVTVAVCEDRVKGIKMLEKDHDLIILDDAYQHRRVRAGFNILLFDYASMFKSQFLLPTGNLREPFFGHKRANAIMITKSPEVISTMAKQKILDKFDESQKPLIHFAVIRYDAFKPVYASAVGDLEGLNKKTKVFLLTGIANTAPLLNHLDSQFQHVVQHPYPDHHQFTEDEISSVIMAFKREPSADKCIITTEKDAQRLLDVRIKELLVDLPVFYLPIAVELEAADKVRFNKFILDYVSNRTRDRTIYKAKDQ